MKNKNIFPTDISQEVVRRYRLYVNRLKDQEGHDLKSITQNYHIIALRAFLRYLAWRGIETLSAEKVPVAKQGDREINFLESAEINNILVMTNTETISGLRDRAMMEVLFSTGMRVSELVNLDTDDINFERGEIAVLGKGKKIRVVFLSKEALGWIDQYIKNRGFKRPEHTPGGAVFDDPLFLSKKGDRITVRSVERIVKKYAELAGITKSVSPHTLRHSFATDLLIAGADIRSVQSMLGHSSITTTQVYTHVTDQHLKEVHDRFHGKS
jgi:site-specific recombinase XerD